MVSAWLVSFAFIAQPSDLARRVAARETESEAARAHYTYRQHVSLEELDHRGARSGQFKEVRDVTFSPTGERGETLVGKPLLTLVRLKMTGEDFRDLREVQPLLLTADRLARYETDFRGEESMDGRPCWLLRVRPRQILEGQRLFEGHLWIDQQDYSIIRSEGRAVPQILSTKGDNLFPRFATERQRLGDGYWFPSRTQADDTLPFRNGPIRIKMDIRYTNYQRFTSESTVTFK